jgi:hypothetical protein
VNADLARVDLTGANLAGANLAGANLAGADLADANLAGAIGLIGRSVCPQTGAFTAFKKVVGGVLELLIPADAARVSTYTGRKCRASKALVVRAVIGDATTYESKYLGRHFLYTVGTTVEVPDFDPDVRVECSRGIHFFMERAEAEAY